MLDDPGETVPPLVFPGAICERIAPGEPSERVESEASAPLRLVPLVAAEPGAAAPPGDADEPEEPGAICDWIAPGEPSDRVALAAEPLSVVVPCGTPMLPVLPVGADAPPGDWPDDVVPGAICDFTSPGDPWD